MELTLRQARSLEARLRNLVLENQIIEVRTYDSDVAIEDINNGIRDLDDEIRHKLKLNDIRHHIKELINSKNMECGVSTLLNERDKLSEIDRIIGTLGQEDSTDRQLSVIESSDDDSRKVSVVRSHHFYTSEGSYGDIDRELNIIKSSLLELNNSHTINLNLEYAIYLQENGLI